jgi:uncharacterized protein
MTQSLTISPTIQRQYILGKQGLWPGRRWTGKTGIAQALTEMEALQMDPVSIVAPSHELVLWSRVMNFQPKDLYSLLYEDRKFFDYGGWLAIYPIEELPYWRVEMEQRKSHPRLKTFLEANPALLEEVRQALQTRGPLRNRDFEGRQVSHYRAGKDTGVAMFYLWLIGELMTHSRAGKERVYDFLERVAPAHLRHTATEEEATEFFFRKAISQYGIVKPSDIRNKARLAEWVEAGQLAIVNVEGEKKPSYLLAEDIPLIETLQNGRVPSSWQPLDTTTLDEVVFLSPLEYVSARGRAKKLFDFDYIWEIYKPEIKRLYGPYTMPVLYGDQLVGRVDMKLDRQSQILRINGFWLEAGFVPDEAFAVALAKGFASLMNFLGVTSLDAEKLEPAFVRERVTQHLRS